jgi:hypothetical protein
MTLLESAASCEEFGSHSVVASFVHGTECPEATSGDAAGTFLVMGCRHALGVCGDEPRIGSPPPLVDPGVDGSIST